MTLPVPQMTVVNQHTSMHMHTHTHTHTCYLLMSINSTDQENPLPDACDVGETQAGAQNRGTKTRGVQSNRRGATCGSVCVCVCVCGVCMCIRVCKLSTTET